MSDLISVIVPIYNTGEPLKECVKSILGQTYSPIEIILVDDGSTERTTLEILEIIKTEYDFIKIIHQKNGGSSKARNSGLDHASGKYIAFVDSDDKIDKDAYANLHKFAVEYNVPLVLGNLKIEGTHQLFGNSGLQDGVYAKKEILSKFLQGYWHSTCTNLYREDIIKEIRFPIGEINEDYIFNFNVISNCNRIALFTKPFYHYIRREDSVTSKPVSIKHLDWLKHTAYVRNKISDEYGSELIPEADFQYLFSNIILSNKCVLNMAAYGHNSDSDKIYVIATHNLRAEKWKIMTNSCLSLKHRVSAMAILVSPLLYKQLLLTILRLR